MAPIDPFEQIAELAGRDRHHAIRRRRPHEASSLQALGVQRGAQPVVPEDLDQLAALAPEDVKVAGMRVFANDPAAVASITNRNWAKVSA